MAKKKVRIAQVGITSHGETILNATLHSDTLELVSLYDLRNEDSRKAADRLGIKQASSYDEIVGDPSVDAVALVTPNHLHASQIMLALDAGKHVFVEKPITRTVAEARSVIAKAKESNHVLMVGHNTRRRAIFRRAKAILQKEKLGIIVGVEMNVSRPVGILEGLPAWKADPQAATLVPMTQLGIHFVDAVHYLLGPVRKVACLANHAAMPGGALDAASAILGLESGIPATLSCYYVTPDVYLFRIYGTKGILNCSVNGYVLQVLNGGRLATEAEEDFSQEGFASYQEEMVEFGECVLNGKEPETGGEGGMVALAVVEAMTESIRTGRVIDVKEILGQ
ncbi:MAG: Gfo/Idh/MocA family oxidoreductase [Ignavibacteriales bacterium]|nr:Gfo/Idh/MocA family oxidoreductase [Ignavibacteriales bacterium]